MDSDQPIQGAGVDPRSQVERFGQRWPRWAFYAACVLFVASGLHLLSQPLRWLLGVVADDGFYYLQVARKLAETGKSTFDGIHPTNGYHPLWMLVSTLCARLVQDRELLLRIVLGVGFVLHLVSGWLLAKTVTLLTTERWGLIAGALWILNPLPLQLLMQGVESPAYFLSLILVLYVYVTAVDPRLSSGRGLLPPRAAVVFGASLGLAFLARTEAALGIAVWLALLGFVLHRKGARRADIAKQLLLVGAPAALVASPWLVFSWMTVGGFSQDSGAMKMLWAKAEMAPMGTLERVSSIVDFMTKMWISTPIGLQFSWRASPFLAGTVMLGLVLAVLAHRSAFQPLYRVTIGAAAAVLATGLTYGCFFGDPQVWHLAQPGLVVFVLVVCWGFAFLRRRSRPRVPVDRIAALALVAMAAFHLRAAYNMKARYPWQRDVYTSQQRFDALMPPDERMGAFNSGIPGYFSARTVVNLDGLVNHAAVVRWKDHDLDGLLRADRIRYIADEQLALDRARTLSGARAHLDVVSSAKLTGWPSGERFLWRVEEPEVAKD
jgi:hypothetical protein